MSRGAPEGLPPGYPFDPELEVSPRQVKALMADAGAGLVLIDCRTTGEWNTARIEGARLIPLDQFAARVGELEAAAAAGGRAFVVHCHHGVRSMKAALFLKQRGLEARSMAGGIDLWSADIDPGVPRY